VGEKQNEPFQLSFNASLKVDFQAGALHTDGVWVYLIGRPGSQNGDSG
jgi:hypothetical protein